MWGIEDSKFVYDIALEEVAACLYYIIHYIDTDRIIAIVHMLPLIENPDELPYA